MKLLKKLNEEGMTIIQVTHNETYANYQSAVRNAVLEVENVLVRVDSLGRRIKDIERARVGYTRYFKAIKAQYQEGAANLFVLEEARRILLGSRLLYLDEQLAQIQAWISLYKAVGGGWKSDDEYQVKSKNI